MSDSKSIALGIIRAEHRALVAVLDSLTALVAEIRDGRMTADFGLFWSMIYYIEAFPDQFHHPKENDWLFARLRLRTHEADALVTDLVRQHEQEEAALGCLRRWLGNFEAGVPGSLEQLEQTIRTYAEFSWKHLRAEEHELMPIAEAHLTSADWDDIAAAFSENGDPLVGKHEGERFIALFRQIVEQAPAPIGLGVSRHS